MGKPLKKTDMSKAWNRSKQKRLINSRPQRKFYLIVCEGEKTEPNYFEGLKRDLPRSVLKTVQIDVEGTGFNTKSLVKKAKELKQKLEALGPREVDQVWVVMDRDSFSAENFNEAIRECENEGFSSAWSNEAFELWYLLHFNYYHTALSRKQYWPKLTELMREELGDQFSYQKNDPNMYEYLKRCGNEQDAIKFAKKLADSYGETKNFADQNPRTEVYRLIEELRALIPDSE